MAEKVQGVPKGSSLPCVAGLLSCEWLMLGAVCVLGEAASGNQLKLSAPTLKR